jgi:hypothetical protein
MSHSRQHLHQFIIVRQHLFQVPVGCVLTINVPVVVMARYVMILRGATSLQGALEGVGPENRDFFWALKWHERSECHLGPKKSSQPSPIGT